jgi:hypothetical protein
MTAIQRKIKYTQLNKTLQKANQLRRKDKKERKEVKEQAIQK